MNKNRFKDWKPPKIVDGKLTKWSWMVQNLKGLKLGRKTDIGAFTYINALYGVDIGDRVQIGSHCSIYSVSTIGKEKGRVVIGGGACIGSHCTIMPGVKVGKGAIVGAHSFVNRDIPAGATAFGVPVKIKKKKK